MAVVEIAMDGTAVPRHSLASRCSSMSIVGEIGLALVILLFALGAVWCAPAFVGE
jgi:hypothetical protein